MRPYQSAGQRGAQLEGVRCGAWAIAAIIITVRRLIGEAWTTYRWDTRPAKRP
jgi:hypothetical protein